MALPVKVKRTRSSQFDFIAQLRRPNGSTFDYRAVLGSKQGAAGRAKKVEDNNPDAEFMVLDMNDIRPKDGEDTPEENLPYIAALEDTEFTDGNLDSEGNPKKSAVLVIRVK